MTSYDNNGVRVEHSLWRIRQEASKPADQQVWFSQAEHKECLILLEQNDSRCHGEAFVRGKRKPSRPKTEHKIKGRKFVFPAPITRAAAIRATGGKS